MTAWAVPVAYPWTPRGTSTTSTPSQPATARSMISRSSVTPGNTVMRPLNAVELVHALRAADTDHLVAAVKRVLDHVLPELPRCPDDADFHGVRSARCSSSNRPSLIVRAISFDSSRYQLPSSNRWRGKRLTGALEHGGAVLGRHGPATTLYGMPCRRVPSAPSIRAEPPRRSAAMRVTRTSVSSRAEGHLRRTELDTRDDQPQRPTDVGERHDRRRRASTRSPRGRRTRASRRRGGAPMTMPGQASHASNSDDWSIVTGNDNRLRSGQGSRALASATPGSVEGVEHDRCRLVRRRARVGSS